MTIEERARRLVGDMPWVTLHLSVKQIEDVKKQIATSMEVAVEEDNAALRAELHSLPGWIVAKRLERERNEAVKRAEAAEARVKELETPDPMEW